MRGRSARSVGVADRTEAFDVAGAVDDDGVVVVQELGVDAGPGTAALVDVEVDLARCEGLRPDRAHQAQVDLGVLRLEPVQVRGEPGRRVRHLGPDGELLPPGGAEQAAGGGGEVVEALAHRGR